MQQHRNGKASNDLLWNAYPRPFHKLNASCCRFFYVMYNMRLKLTATDHTYTFIAMEDV